MESHYDFNLHLSYFQSHAASLKQVGRSMKLVQSNTEQVLLFLLHLFFFIKPQCSVGDCDDLPVDAFETLVFGTFNSDLGN